MQRLWIAALSIVLLAATTADVPVAVSRTIAGVVAKPMYAHSPFGIFLADQTTGDVLMDQSGEKMFVTGSIMKTYSTASALKFYGPNYRFRTPVYRTGMLRHGILEGNLILVASGDFSFGLRDRPNGTLAFNSLPQIDHNYASTGFPGAALVPNSDPLDALNELAHKVRAASILRVRDVAIDDRLFTSYNGWPDGLIAPIWVNENLIDVTVTPASAGRLATLQWRPRTSSFTVRSRVMTVAAGTKTEPLEVVRVSSSVFAATGQIAADAKPILVNTQIDHPSAFARIAFIDALRRAGVAVTASASGPNPAGSLPNIATYTPGTLVAQHISPPFSQYVKVILKVSYNRGADLMVCLIAVRSGSHACAAGLAPEVKTVTALGVSPGTIIYDGAGSEDNGRTSPADEATFLRELFTVPWGHYIHDGMEILGVDGLQATNGVGTPAAGNVRMKDGTRLIGSPSGQVYFPAKTDVGYIDAKTGRKLVFGIFLNDIPTDAADSFQTFQTIDHDETSIIEALQANY